MRIATWNVNSIKQRMPRLVPWLDERRPDVVCLQETKLADDALTELLGDELASRGYEFAAHGETAWNGVASGMNTVMRTLGGALGGQLSATFLADNVAHGHPALAGFTNTYLMATIFLVVCMLAALLVPKLSPAAGRRQFDGPLEAVPEAG